jgi:hypothetical protein
MVEEMKRRGLHGPQAARKIAIEVKVEIWEITPLLLDWSPFYREHGLEESHLGRRVFVEWTGYEGGKRLGSVTQENWVAIEHDAWGAFVGQGVSPAVRGLLRLVTVAQVHKGGLRP